MHDVFWAWHSDWEKEFERINSEIEAEYRSSSRQAPEPSQPDYEAAYQSDRWKAVVEMAVAEGGVAAQIQEMYMRDDWLFVKFNADVCYQSVLDAVNNVTPKVVYASTDVDTLMFECGTP